MKSHVTRMIAIAALVLAGAGCSDDAKKNVGDDCSNNTDCADEICHSGICVSKNPLKNGASCEDKGFCKSITCEGGVCVPGKAADGAKCLNHEECVSSACTGGICGGKPDGGTGGCTSDADCTDADPNKRCAADGKCVTPASCTDESACNGYACFTTDGSGKCLVSCGTNAQCASTHQCQAPACVKRGAP